MRKDTHNKKPRDFADYIIYISIFMVTVFTIAAFVLQFRGLMEVSATLTTCWFAFWTVEIVSLAAIKTSKVKNGYKKANEESAAGLDDEIDDNEIWEVDDDGISG